MKKLAIFAILGTALMVSPMVFGSMDLNKKHADKTGKDGAKVNCAYCHTTAGIKKEKGLDMAALQKGDSCAMAGCHK